MKALKDLWYLWAVWAVMRVNPQGAAELLEKWAYALKKRY